MRITFAEDFGRIKISNFLCPTYNVSQKPTLNKHATQQIHKNN